MTAPLLAAGSRLFGLPTRVGKVIRKSIVGHSSFKHVDIIDFYLLHNHLDHACVQCSAAKKQTDIIGRTQDNMKITNLLPVKVCARHCGIDQASSVSTNHGDMPFNLACLSFMRTVRKKQ